MKRSVNSKEKYMEHLNKIIFKNEKMMLSPEKDSCDLHALTHEDTEILGMFCDVIPVHGDELKKILLLGYLEYIKEKKYNEVDVIID